MIIRNNSVSQDEQTLADLYEELEDITDTIDGVAVQISDAQEEINDIIIDASEEIKCINSRLFKCRRTLEKLKVFKIGSAVPVDSDFPF